MPKESSIQESIAIRGILFDKDGTLLDYAATWMTANRVAALAAAGTMPTTLTSKQIPEEIAEQVGEVAQVAEILETRMPAASPDASEAKAIVGTPLVRVRENRVGLRSHLETLLSGGIVRIPVGMVLERDLPIGLLQLGLFDAARDAQDFVVIALRQWIRASTG